MILQIDAKSFSVFRSENRDYSMISIVSSDVRKSPEDLEHLITYLMESYPREEIRKQLRALGLLEEE